MAGSGIQNLIYEWDPNDNLSARRDYQQLPPVYETFAYDNLDRIDYSQRNGVTNVEDVAYDALGNVTSKSDVGRNTYDATKIHAVTAAGSNSYAYDANGNMTSRNASNVTWFSYDLPMRIYASSSVTYLQYGPDRSLWRQEATTSGVTETTTYVGDVVEKVTKDGVTTWKHYVEAPTGTAAVYLASSLGRHARRRDLLSHPRPPRQHRQGARRRGRRGDGGGEFHGARRTARQYLAGHADAGGAGGDCGDDP